MGIEFAICNNPDPPFSVIYSGWIVSIPGLRLHTEDEAELKNVYNTERHC